MAKKRNPIKTTEYFSDKNGNMTWMQYIAWVNDPDSNFKRSLMKEATEHVKEQKLKKEKKDV